MGREEKLVLEGSMRWMKFDLHERKWEENVGELPIIDAGHADQHCLRGTPDERSQEIFLMHGSQATHEHPTYLQSAYLRSAYL